MEVVVLFVVVVAALALLDMAALRWGVISRPSIEKPERETGQDWDMSF